MVLQILTSIPSSPWVESVQTGLNLNAANYDAMWQNLSIIDWEERFCAKSTIDKWGIFKKEICDQVASYIPVVMKSTSDKPLWFNNRVAYYLKQKRKLLTKYCCNKSPENFSNNKALRNKTSSILRSTRRNLECTITSEVKSNQRSFWRYIKQKTHGKTPLVSLNNSDGKTINNTKDIAQCLNHYFSSVFVSDQKSAEVFSQLPDYQIKLENVMISENLVNKYLKGIKIGKSPGPDEMMPRVI